MSQHSNSTELSYRQLLGMNQDHLVSSPLGLGGAEVLLHAQTADALKKMRDAARANGVGLCVASGFRSFERQLAIWNAKADGERDCLDDQGNALDLGCMDSWQAVQSILRFSALPGTSRHHWGSDMDLYDELAVASDYRLQLIAEEYAEGGPFQAMYNWLNQHAGEYGFFYPYGRDRGGVAPEPWHLSYRPVADACSGLLDKATWAQMLEPVDLAYKETVMAKLDDIFERFVEIP